MVPTLRLARLGGVSIENLAWMRSRWLTRPPATADSRQPARHTQQWKPVHAYDLVVCAQFYSRPRRGPDDLTLTCYRQTKGRFAPGRPFHANRQTFTSSVIYLRHASVKVRSRASWMFLSISKAAIKRVLDREMAGK